MAELIDLTGKKFGRLTVIRKGDGRKTTGGAYKATWICKCDCGNITEIDGEKIRKGHTTSCGCHKKDNRGGKFENLIGRKFNHLTVIDYIPKEDRSWVTFCWLCKCDCGNITKASTSKLKNGEIVSCGCAKKNRIGNLNKKYEFTNKRLYGVYKSMTGRCYDTKHVAYKSYGGRGITVYEEWLGEKGFDVFAKWAIDTGYDPDAKYGRCTIDRIDVNGNYEPDNCRWVTSMQQQNNKRTNVRVEYDGETHTIAEWSRMLNISYNYLRYHLVRGRTIAEIKEMYAKKNS